MKTQMINFEGMALETLAEAANDAGEQVEKHAKSAVSIAITAGRALTAAKSQVPHGEWLGWLGKNWNYKQSTAHSYMQIANSQHAGNLADAKSIREALRMITDAKQETEPEIVPRAERKTGRVEVQEVGQTIVQAEEAKPEKDDDPNPAPKTNTKHTPATAKAKEADRPAPQAITPVIIEEPEQEAFEIDPKTLSDFGVDEIFEFIETISGGDEKAFAKRLRHLADRLDPPKAGKPPGTVQLILMIPNDWAPELQKAAADWAEYKQARAKGERIQTVRAWELALEKFTSQPAAVVVSKVNTAIEKSWKGWDHDSANQQSGKAIAGTGRIKPAAIDESAITWK